MGVELERKAYQKLLDWKRESNGRSALLVNGMRRVGKTHLLERFGRSEYRSCLFVRFGEADPGLIDIFCHDSYDLDIFFEKLSAFHGVKLCVRESLVVFDDVHLCPLARQMIKRLVEDGRYDYIEAGSLVNIRENIQDILLPSEEEGLDLCPLDFEEFLWAMGNETAGPYMRKCFEELSPLGALQNMLMNQFRRYMLVGGMPEAVSALVETGSIDEAEKAKRRILELYDDDIERYAGDYKGAVRRVLDSLPSQLDRREKRFILSRMGRNARSRQFDKAFYWLSKSSAVSFVFNADDPDDGLFVCDGSPGMKLYMADTGLLATMAVSSGTVTEERLRRGFLVDDIGINNGMFAENVTAQALRSTGKKLFFYSRYAKRAEDGSVTGQTIEIDFLIRKGRDICPIEVKSSKWVRHDSIDRFNLMFGKRLGRSYVLCTKDLSVEGNMVFLPLYMAFLL